MSLSPSLLISDFDGLFGDSASGRIGIDDDLDERDLPVRNRDARGFGERDFSGSFLAMSNSENMRQITERQQKLRRLIDQLGEISGLAEELDLKLVRHLIQMAVIETCEHENRA
ncbi:ABC-type lipopolysaccharide export system ATPase subunit [Rhodopseudomonas rhenobacensis]|uniref:ABC-type lipopolysaccharide export system ATPase subunit n=1 Tax=Rhodopseudomonas rhenobacensis TaxID=87461 RepID=A0A7W7Z2K4_9BRAD|nr:hypothetical protein [Rhodopseudomonas rhenobacensis]MBB5046870.1 ABC-type lipopolysaccharide export system ATPase subunit [Rhodopseudomonas rhenobacensis]